ncbi:aspartyl/asparaginyl beta-hydroxylase domain-containing protein [Phormidium tenue FACHB-886]|nr:aspartyl/asparaginyl beta-hydroxylase domain-containing protein [Phormidium tenue FACHB-886]
MYYDASQFEFVRNLEAHWQTMRQELDRLKPKDFVAYPERYLLDKHTGWDVFGLYFVGVKIDINCELCPQTAKLVKAVPGMTTAGFSSLAAGAHIVPHSGRPSGVLRCHMGLDVPERCALRVGKEIKTWKEGQCLVFDDTSEHEAWNLSNRPRTVLLLDFKVPPGFVFARSN